MSHPGNNSEKCSPVPPKGDVRLPSETSAKQREGQQEESLRGGHGKKRKKEQKSENQVYPIPPRGSVWGKSTTSNRGSEKRKRKAHSPNLERSPSPNGNPMAIQGGPMQSRLLILRL